jgi:hypothetical protein
MVGQFLTEAQKMTGLKTNPQARLFLRQSEYRQEAERFLGSRDYVRVQPTILVLWDFPECKIAVISMSYVHMYLSENVEKSVKQCVRPLRFPSTSLR